MVKEEKKENAPKKQGGQKLAVKTGGRQEDQVISKQGEANVKKHGKPNTRRGSKAGAKPDNSKKVKIIPLGGLDEIGKNLTVMEYGNDLVIIDCGLAFPDESMPGIDMVIPDITYLQKQKNRIRGIILTHGHEDHIGAIPYVLREFNVPVYGTALTLGILKNKLKEHGLLNSSKLNVLNAGETVTLGSIKAEFIRSNHSIADAVMVALHTPAGIIMHTGDFKIDSTPITGEMIDLARIGELGKEGVLVLLSESTNAERSGFTMSERTVGKTFDQLFYGCNKRIFVATFASNVDRVQQIINAAAKYDRKVAISGRSMVNVMSTAIELGYVTVPKNTLIDIDEVPRYPKEKLLIITTGSQGEPMAALSRMAFSDHKKITIDSGDLVVISATPIPGNEKTVGVVINELCKKGAEVIYKALAEVHVSGHACQEELKIILGLAKPKYFIPTHGEYRHLSAHKELAKQMGYDSSNIFVMSIGEVFEASANNAKVTGTVPAGKVFVDGLGVGDVGNIVLRDRKHLAEDGLIVVVVTIETSTGQMVAGPDIISRGFVYVRESEDLMEKVRTVALKSLENCRLEHMRDWASLKTRVRNDLSDFLFSKTKRKPMILPVIMEV